MKLSEIIIEYRKRLAISQREFSRRCGLSNTYISFLENEKNPKTGKPMVPTLEIYKKLADGMDLSVHHLFELLDRDAPVDLRSTSVDDIFYSEQEDENLRILINGVKQLPPEKIEQVINMIKIMFPEYSHYFERG